MKAEQRIVVVYGATGHAGGRIARRLIADGSTVVVAGQNAAKVTSLARELGCSGRTASLSDAGALAKMCAGARVVVNCAGPFATTATRLAEACVATSVDYVDISGERASVRSMLDLHASAARAGVALVPAAGAKGGLGSWAMAYLTGHARPLANLEIAYAHAGSAYWRPSAGALLSVAGEGVEWEARRPLDHGPPPRAFDFPPPFRQGLAVHVTGPEEIALPDQPQTAARVYMAVDPGSAGNIPWGLIHHPICAGLTRPTAPVIWRAFIDAGAEKLSRMLRPPGDGALALVVDPGARGRALAISTLSGYETTSAIVSLCVERLCAGAPKPVGLVSPATLIPAREALRALVRSGTIRVLRDGRTRR